MPLTQNSNHGRVSPNTPRVRARDRRTAPLSDVPAPAMRASTSEPTASTSDDRRTTAHRRDGAMATTATATAMATAMNARHTNRARRVRSAASARVGVRTRRRLSSASGPGGWCAVIHSNTDRAHQPHQSRTRQLTSWRHLATRTHRARIAHRRSRVRRTFVSHFAVVESPSSSHARRGARARLWRVFKHRRSRSWRVRVG